MPFGFGKRSRDHEKNSPAQGVSPSVPQQQFPPQDYYLNAQRRQSAQQDSATNDADRDYYRQQQQQQQQQYSQQQGQPQDFHDEHSEDSTGPPGGAAGRSIAPSASSQPSSSLQQQYQGQPLPPPPPNHLRSAPTLDNAQQQTLDHQRSPPDFDDSARDLHLPQPPQEFDSHRRFPSQSQSPAALANPASYYRQPTVSLVRSGGDPAGAESAAARTAEDHDDQLAPLPPSKNLPQLPDGAPSQQKKLLKKQQQYLQNQQSQQQTFSRSGVSASTREPTTRPLYHPDELDDRRTQPPPGSNVAGLSRSISLRQRDAPYSKQGSADPAGSSNIGPVSRQDSLERDDDQRNQQQQQQQQQNAPLPATAANTTDNAQQDSQRPGKVDPYLGRDQLPSRPLRPVSQVESQGPPSQGFTRVNTDPSFVQRLGARDVASPASYQPSPLPQQLSQEQYHQQQQLQPPHQEGYDSYQAQQEGALQPLPSPQVYEQQGGPQFPPRIDSHDQQQHQYLSQPPPGTYQAFNPGDQQQQPVDYQNQAPGDLMAPPRGAGQPRRSQESNAQLPQPPGPRDMSGMQNYQQGQQGQPGPPQGPPQGQNQFSSPPNQGPPGQQFRGQGPPQVQNPDRSTPPPAQEIPMDMQLKLQELEEIKRKYKRVKDLYFDRCDQIEHLQNTLANQRMSQSRTSLDDGEYVNRFNRLDGAIKDLSLSLRQSWNSVPGWLQKTVNQNAHVNGTKEMMVVGRASISRWIKDEIFDHYFHPGLERKLSEQLKIIEKNIQDKAPIPQSIEDEDAVHAKMCTWRLTTIDALQESLSNPRAAENRAKLTDYLTQTLVLSLSKYLNDPAPPGLEAGVRMIIELAVGIAANLPLESRDVRVEYFMPGELFFSDHMKAENPLPPITTTANDSKGDSTEEGPSESQPKSDLLKDRTRGGMLGSIRRPVQAPGRGNAQQPGDQNLAPQNSAAGASQVSLQSNPGQSGSLPPGQGDEQRIRVAGFMAVEVRGKSVLVKAPVWPR